MERSSVELQITVLSSERIKTVFAYDSILATTVMTRATTNLPEIGFIIVDGTKSLCEPIRKSITTKSVRLSARKLLRIITATCDTRRFDPPVNNRGPNDTYTRYISKCFLHLKLHIRFSFPRYTSSITRTK